MPNNPEGRFGNQEPPREPSTQALPSAGGETPPHDFRPRCCYAALLLVVLLLGAIRFRLRDTPLERDEGEYGYAGQLLLQGIPPYELAYNMKLPGTYAAYAAIMAVFGQTTAGIRLGLLLVNAATIILVFLLAKKLASPLAGLVAGITYALLSCLPSVLGFAGHATHFVVLFALAGILVLLRACLAPLCFLGLSCHDAIVCTRSSRRYVPAGTFCTRESPPLPTLPMKAQGSLLFFFGGFLLGVAFLMKQPGIAFAAFGALYIIHCTWKDPRLLAARLAAYLVGVTLPFVLTCLALTHAGVFRNFWFWTFTYAREYSSATTLAVGSQALQKSLQWVLHPFPLWALAEIGAVCLVWDRRWRPHIFFVGAFTAFSLLAVSAGFYFRPHYFILLLPAASILAGVAVTSATCFLAERRLRGMVRPIPLLVFLAACALTLWQQRAFLFLLDPASAGQKIYAANPFAEAIDAARTVRASTTSSDTIAVFGSEPEIYFYSRRRSATAYIYMYDLIKSQPYQLEMQREMMRQIESARPRMVIYVDDWASWGWRAGQEHDEFFLWMDHYLRENYEQVQQIQINALPAHRWGQSANLYLFRRTH